MGCACLKKQNAMVRLPSEKSPLKRKLGAPSDGKNNERPASPELQL